MMTYAYPIWLFFAAFFFYFAYIHWREGGQQVRPFVIRQRDNPEAGAPVDPVLAEANKQFVKEFNDYLKGVNTLNHSRHRAAAVGYTLAGIIAMASMALMLFLS
jgi:hypothetical protein